MGKKLIALLMTLAVLLALTGTCLAAEGQSTSPDDATGFVSLAEAAPDVILEIRYYSTYNFVGERVDGYEEPCALMTKEAAEALNNAAAEAEEQGYRLKVYDAYRPQMAVDHFVRWAVTCGITRSRA